MIRDFARALIIVLAILLVIADVQKVEEAADIAALSESAPPVRATQTDF